MAALTVVPPAVPAASPLTLFAAEEQLLAMTATADMVAAEEQADFARALTEARSQAAAKRDAVARFLAHVESQAALAAAEIALLQRRKRGLERAAERVKGMVIRTIQAIGKDDRGRWLKLEGNISSLMLKGCVQTVEVEDADAVPLKHKKASVTLPAELWERVLDELPMDLAGEVLAAVKPRVEVSVSAVKAAIDAGESVPGAKLVGGVFVVRK